MTIIEQIKAEIERLKNYAEESKKEWVKEGYNQNAFAEDCRISSFDKLLSFISTLESEKPISHEEELEEEIQEYMSNEDNNPFDWDWRDKRDCARHFAKWGAEHTPLPEDTVLFNKGVAEGKRLMIEEAVCYIAQPDITATGNIVIPFIRIGYTALSRYGIKVGDKVRIIIIKD